MLRGNNQQEVFVDEEDKTRIIATILENDEHFTILRILHDG